MGLQRIGHNLGTGKKEQQHGPPLSQELKGNPVLLPLDSSRGPSAHGRVYENLSNEWTVML